MWSLASKGVNGKASLSLTFMGGKVTLAFSTTLGHPTQYPLQPLALKLRLLDLKLLNLQLLDLQLLDFQLLDLKLIDLVPYGSANADRPSKRGTVSGEGQASNNPATAPSVSRVSEQECKCNRCKHSFYNNKSLKILNGKTSK